VFFPDNFGSKYGDSRIFLNSGNSLWNWSAASVNDTLTLFHCLFNYIFLCYTLFYPFVLRFRAIFLFYKFQIMPIDLYLSHRPSKYFYCSLTQKQVDAAEQLRSQKK
jgi:hypothetical protein